MPLTFFIYCLLTTVYMLNINAATSASATDVMLLPFEKSADIKTPTTQRATPSHLTLVILAFRKIAERTIVKIEFDEPIDTTKYTIVSGMSVIPKVRVK